MTKTQRIDALRNIWKQRASFLSIVMIAMLAVNAYLGIAYTAEALDRNVTAYYDEHNAHDFSVYSPLLLTAEDLSAIRGLKGIADAEGCFETSAWISSENFGATAVSVLSVPERISMPVMQEGRLPENAGEAAIEVKLMEEQGLSIGDRIHIASQAGGTPALMAETDFTVTGVFYHPDHINLGFMTPTYILVTGDAFDQELLQGAWPRARVRMAGTPEDRFSDAYWNQAEPVEQALKELSGERSPRRGQRPHTASGSDC